MLRRFNLHFALFDAERLAEMPQETLESEQLVLCSLACSRRARTCRPMPSPPTGTWWHRTRPTTCTGPPPAPARTTLFVEACRARGRAAAGTATPEQISQASHFARLRLLTRSLPRPGRAFQAEEQQYRHLSELADAWKRASSPPTCRRAGPHAPAATLIAQMLDRHGTGRVLFRNTRAAVAGFPSGAATVILPVPEQYSFA